MQAWLAVIPALPLAGFVILALVDRAPKWAAAAVGVGSVAGSAAVSIAVAAWYVASPPPGGVATQVLWQWLQIDGLSAQVALTVDALAVVMILVVTVVGLLIHVYSASYMADDDGYRRFFAWMNLFVSAMLVLVLADNLLLLFVGWEGVGLCSYLLIGFWYDDPANGRAARKAFWVTRVGDAAMTIGLILLALRLGTLRIDEFMARAAAEWPVGSGLAVVAALLLLAGAVGKSAQLPLQTWLPDAMAGPTPVSALIHAATMVTAGVYLIARTHTLFELAPAVMTLVAIIGAATLLISGVSACAQRDIKRVLAYSTISQVAYMFLALGVGAFSAGVFHLVSHAMFKSLLFLGAGVVIHATGGEHDMYEMGGLRRKLPLTFWTFLIGAMGLAALPPVTAGFASKDLILYHAWMAGGADRWLWLAGVVGALLTGAYTFRMVFLTFFGTLHRQPQQKASPTMAVPLLLLAGGCFVAGLLQWPRTLGGRPVFTRFLDRVLPPGGAEGSFNAELVLQLISLAAALTGLAAAYVFVLRKSSLTRLWKESRVGSRTNEFIFGGCGFDWLYDRLLVRPFVWIARINHRDIIDIAYDGLTWLAGLGYAGMSRSENGKARTYVMILAGGAAVTIAIAVML